MSEIHTPSSNMPATRFVTSVAMLAVLMGVMVLVGWAFDIVAFKSIVPGWFAMKANFAITLIFIGIALWLIVRPLSTSSPQRNVFLFFLAWFLVLLVGLIGVVTLVEYILGWDPGFDQWLFREPVGAVGTSHPGRMAQDAALCLVLLATALLVSGGSHQTRQTMRVSISLGLLVATLGLTAMLSHLTPGLGAYGWFGFSIMSMHAAAIIVLLGMAVIAINWQPEVMQWSLSTPTSVAFACGMIVLVFIGFNTSRSQYLMKDINRQISYSEEVTSAISDLLIETIDAHAHVRGYVITGDEQFKIHYLEAKANSNVKLDALRLLIIDNLHQQRQFALIEEQVNAEFQWFEQAIDAERTGISNAARNKMVVQDEGMLDNLRNKFTQVESDHHQLVEQLNLKLESASRLSYLTIVIGTLTSLIIFLIVIFRLNSITNDRKRTEGEYSTLIQTSLDGFWINDFSGRILDVNEALCQMLGYTREDLLRMGIPDIEASETPEQTSARILKIIQTGGDRFQTRHRRKDGAIIDMEVSVQYNAELGERFFAFYRDITERKRAEEALQLSNTALKEAHRIARIGSWDWNVATDRHTWSEEVYQIYGRDPKLPPADYREVPKYFTPESWIRLSAAVEAGLAEGSPYECDAEVVRPDGTHRWITARGKATYGVDGKITRLNGTVQDITERKQAEVVLRESKHRLDEAQHIGKLGFLDWNFITNEIELSEETLQMYGLDPAKNIIGVAEIIKLVHPDDADLAVNSLNNAIEGKGKHDVEHRIVRPDGKLIYVHTNAEIFRDADGKAIRVLGTVQDITERKLAEQEIHQLNAELEQRVVERTAQLELAIADLEGFSYSVSHDLRTPLRAIDGFSNILLEDYSDKLDTEGQRLLNVVRSNTIRMSTLIDDILQFSRAGRVDVKKSNINMDDLTHQVIDELNLMDKRSTINISIEKLLPAEGDQALLHQVLENLIANAIKFSGKVESPRVRIGSHRQDHEIVYFVQDNGTGFDMKYADKLFGVFQRLHSINEFEGTGIGLAIAKRIINRLGGRIWAEAEVGKGATFYFSIPDKEHAHE